MLTKTTVKRYTEEERAEILSFIEKYNEEHGRGGQSAAIHKYKVTAITIGNWKNGRGNNGNQRKVVKKTFRNPSKYVVRLDVVTKQIERAEALLEKLHAEAKELRKEIRLAIDA